MFKRLVLISIAAFLLVACSNPQPSSTAVSTPADETLVLGVMSDSNTDVSHIQPLADYLASQLGDYGISCGKVRVAGSVEEMSDWLTNGDVDLYFDSVYPAALVRERTGASLILRSWQYGGSQTYSVIFANQSSGVTNLSDLPGKMIAMTMPGSTTGFFLPAAYLVENGFNLAGKKSFADPTALTEVGFIFSGGDESTLQLVLSGSVAAGVMDDYNYEVAFPPEVTQKLVVLARTEAIARQVVLARPGLDPQLLSSAVESMTEMQGSEAGKSALASFQTNQFEPFPEGPEAASQQMKRMLSMVKNIPMP